MLDAVRPEPAAERAPAYRQMGRRPAIIGLVPLVHVFMVPIPVVAGMETASTFCDNRDRCTEALAEASDGAGR
ncbi:hypothetical protein [Streptomyces cinnamoneus]|uniref:hypothetical protein n=1 Tax=Streptomyces cinnamoneus TaxID=53446 RepID=UPI00167E88EA|nr:hypothetical protein [Streptomyces cinnamoneus]